MALTIYKSKKGITAYCAKCRVRWHHDSTDYNVVEKELTRFENEHAHVTPKTEGQP